VLARPGQGGQPRLVAYGVVRAGAAADARSLRQACEARLPDYMVPSAYVLLPSLPLTENGKLDRNALPEPDLELHAVHEAYVAPRNALEMELARVWSEVLGVERVGVHDNFFALGGDSIIMLQIIAQASRADLKLNRRHLMAFQTIAELASAIAEQLAEAVQAKPASGQSYVASAATMARIEDAGSDIEDAYPLSPLQQGLLFHALYAPGQDLYLEQIHSEIQGSLEPDCFERAWQNVTERNAVLRTSFVWEGVDEPVQRVERLAAFAVQRLDWQAMGRDEQAKKLALLLEQDRKQGFDLSAAPLSRVVLIQLDAQRWHWIWTHHHLLLDGWCVSLVIGELLACYEAYRQGQTPQLPKRRPYRDYIDWLAAQDKQAAETFWRDWLAGLDAPSRFHLLEHDSAIAGDGVGQGEAVLSFTEEETARLQAWTRQQQITQNALVSGAWAYLLHIYAGVNDVVYGVTVAGRPEDLEGFEDMIGLFINTLPMRIRIDHQARLADWLRELQTRQARLRDFEFSRLTDIQHCSGLPAGESLFETLLVFENYPVDKTIKEYAGGLSFGQVNFVERSHYGIALAAIPGNTLWLKLYYDNTRYAAETIQPILAQLRQLLLSAVTEEIGTLADWPWIDRPLRERMVHDWAGLDRAYPPLLAHQIFERQAEQAPDRIALSFEDRHVSYRELSLQSNRLAHFLRRQGVGPEALVGLYLERSIEAVVSILAVWKAGGAYLPLDPAYADQRLTFMAEDAEIRLVLTQSHLQESCPLQSTALLDLDAAWAAIQREPSSCPAVAISPDHLAYVIYTSGSTGKPKGTLLSHRGLSNLGQAQSDFFGVEPNSRVLQFASLSFDASVSEIVMALFKGASLQLARHEDLLPGEGFVKRLAEQRITHITMTPSVLAMSPLTELPDLQSLIVAGEACSATLRAQWAKGRAFFNAYGPTEVTVCASMADCAEGRLHIGQPIANARVYVLDSDGQPVPPGVPGELHVGGIGLARGYLNRPAMSAERFIPDAQGRLPGKRLYKTGDRVRRLPDGNLEFLGRIDRQVKLRGYRIELEEIEQVLRQRGGLREATVLLRPGPADQAVLVAYGVAGEDVVSPASLRAVCQEWLPDYMAPAAYVLLAELPVSATGKLDRDALPAPDFAQHTARESYIAPRNETEAALAKVWGEVLGLKQVGVEDNFFALGGDSIISLQIVSKTAQTGLRVSPRDLFQHPTVAELAVIARREGRTLEQAESATAPVPLTPIQHWFFEQPLAHVEHWNQAVLLNVGERCSAEILASALTALNQRHAALRLRFEQIDNGWTQRYSGREGIVFERIALPDEPDAQQAFMAQQADAAQRSLDLQNGPLGRAVLFEGRERYLLVVVHHLVIDGVSWRILLADWQQYCEQALAGAAFSIAEAGVSYAAWGRKLAELAANDKALGLAHWLALEQKPYTPLPVDMPEALALNRTGSSAMVELAMETEETSALLRQVPPVYHTQVNDILLAAFAQAIAAWTGQGSVWVNLEGHGRETLFEDFDLSQTVGWFTSVFPVVLTADSDPACAIKSAKERLRQIPAGGVGFGIARYLSPDASVRARLAALTEPTISFNYLGQLDQADTRIGLFSLADGPVGSGQHADDPRRHLLDVVASVKGGRFHIAWIYPSAAYHPETIEALAQTYLASLRGLIAHCLSAEGGYTPSDFPLSRLDQAALDRVVAAKPDFEDIYALSSMQQGLLFHCLFESDRAVYLEQLHGELLGDLDMVAFERAWQETIQRHPIFRTLFLWRNLAEPVQLVVKQAAFSIDFQDWRGVEKTEQSAQLEQFLLSDRRLGLDLEQAPLMRVTLIRLAEQRWHWAWTHHHILLDGWCLSLVVREVLQSYQTTFQSVTMPSRRSRPYRDYIAWLHAQDADRAEAHWRQLLAGFTAPTRLNLAAPNHPAAASAEAAPVELWLSAEESRQLEDWARHHQITANTLVQGAWARLLQTYANHEDVVFGVTVSGRPAGLAGSGEMIGLFINSLPLRVGSGRGFGLADWLAGIQRQQSAMSEFEYSRLADVQHFSDVPAGEPLFETLLAFDNYPVDATLQAQFGGLEVREVQLVERTHFPLALSVVPGEEFKFRALYDGRRYDGDSIRSLLERLAGLLRSAIYDLAATVDEWALPVSASDMAPPPSLPLRCVHLDFAAIAAARGDAIALSFEGKHLSYRELELRANHLANRLRDLGVGPEVRVGLYFERSPDLIVGILGILKAGGAYVPFDPTHPSERISFMLEDSGIACLLSRADVAAKLGPVGVDLILQDDTAIAATSASAPPLETSLGNTAYIIYTSGSTGRPKGCLITHENLARLMAQTQDWYRFGTDDVWTLFHSAAFDFSVWEIWGALLYGGRLVVVPYSLSRSPDEFHSLVEREGVTVLNQTPSAFRQFIAADEARPGAALALRHVIFGGEALQLESLRGWFQRHGDQSPKLVNMYGITETTVHVTYRPIQLADLDAGLGSVIGVPIPDLGIQVLDVYQQPMPSGLPGEMYVSGEGVARGYWQRPGLTAERMIPNPFGPGRLYRTGDLARIGTDGLEYLGRIDEQVKIRGFRIELGEIEAVLAEHAQIREAVVLARADTAGEKRLAAYLVRRELDGEPSLTAAGLRSFLSERLPDYMLPQAFVFMDAMPLTGNGKVKRSALPAPDEKGELAEEAYIAPRTTNELALAQVWAEVLGVERVGIHDNFFALGGDSIRSIRLLSRCRELGLALAFQDLAQHPTIAELAGLVSGDSNESRTLPFELVSEATKALLPTTVEDAYPLTLLQKGMFFHSGFEVGSTAYHDVMSYHLQAPYDATAMREALANSFRRHGILRTSFYFGEFDEPLQLVHREVAVPLAETDLRGLEDDEQQRLIRAWAEAESSHPLAWEEAPLLRVQIHRRADDRFQFGLSVHHAILDGWSVASLLAELFQQYATNLGRPVLPPPPVALSFREYVALERQALADLKQREFWAAYLEDAPFAQLPRLGASSTSGPNIARAEVPIPEATSDSLKRLAGHLGLPLRTLLLAAHLRALAFITNQPDTVTGLVSNGRLERADGDRTLGLFLNTLPLRLKAQPGSWVELIRQTAQAEQAITPHRRYPLSEIQKAAGSPGLFEVDFNFVHFHVLNQAMSVGGEFQVLGADTFEETNFTLAVNFSVLTDTGRIAGALDYDAGSLSAAQMGRYANYYGRILAAIAENPDARHERLALLPESELQQQLSEFQGEKPEFAELGLHGLFETQVLKTPDAIALSMDDVRLSFAELNRWANRLAWRLIRLGVGPDTLVGIGLESSPQRVVALLAVLKAGGAYLPLDPAYPAQRLAWMLEDSQTAHLISLPGALPEGLPKVAHTIWLDQTPLAEADTNPAIALSLDNLAYTLYTSGSTGRPKGAQITHRAIVNHMQWMQRVYPLTAADRVLQKTPFSFDASVWEFWAPLGSGAELCLAHTGGQQDPHYLIDTIREQGITILQLVPTLQEALLVEPAFTECRSLRRVYVGGEALRPELARHFKVALAQAELINLYGPTETTIDATSHLFQDDGMTATVPIGRPIDHNRAYVLDGQFRPLPLGSEGEIMLAGAGLGRGYLGRAGMTAERFLPDPFSETPGGRLYRSGDMGHWLASGELKFSGRADQQVKLRGFRIEMGEIESVLLGHPLVRLAAVAVQAGTAGGQRLVAYLVPTDAYALSRGEVREFLSLRLPEHMVPAVFVVLETMPLTPSGKINRKALPLPVEEESVVHRAYRAATNMLEKTLAEIWSSLLGVTTVGVDDNFYELGGDSILSLQIVSRARMAGIKITPKLILQGQTVASVAAQAERIGLPTAEQSILLGDVPLSPIQQDFFGRGLTAPSHWNQSLLLSVSADFSPAAFSLALQAVVNHHDALRLRFAPTTSGWRQHYGTAPIPPAQPSSLAAHEPSVAYALNASPAGDAAQIVCENIDLSKLDDADKPNGLFAHALSVQASLDITHGPMLRAVHFDFGTGREGRLLLAVHHLVIDAVSWRILQEDLLSAYEQALHHQAIHLPAKTASFRSWVQRLQAHADSADAGYWLGLDTQDIKPLPVDHPIARRDNTEANVDIFSVHLDADYTRALLHELPRLTRTQVGEALLASLLETLGDWTGGPLWLDLEGHGREDLTDAPDVSRTVGWFTSLFPMRLSGGAGLRADRLLRRVKSDLRAVPNKGLDFGVARYLSSDAALRERLAALPPREISFNYLGRFDSIEVAEATFRSAIESIGPDNEKAYLLEILARVADGVLTVDWIYAAQLYEPETIERLAQRYLRNLQDLIVKAAASEELGYVPSDFPLAGLSQAALDQLLAGRGSVADVLPLSPLQEGLLFHALDESGHGEYIQQITAWIDGEPVHAAFARAWARTLERHAALRASFHGVELSRPVQIIHSGVACAITWLDWRGLTESEREARWQDLLGQDRLDGIDPAIAPLMRIQMIHDAEWRWRMLWTHHHLILDGWSLPVVLGDVQTFYRQALAGVESDLPPPRPYADYLAWLTQRELAEAEAYWREALHAYTTPLELALAKPSAKPATDFAEVEADWPESLTAALAALAQSQRVTLNTVMQSLFAMMLARYSRSNDVVFGVTVSGRPADLPGIEQTAGLFINSLPLRLPVLAEQSAVEFLRETQQRQTALSQFEYSRLVDVQGYSDMPREQSLFDTLFIFENYPMGDAAANAPTDFSVRRVVSVERTHYPLTCLVLPGRAMNVKLVYQTARFNDAAITRFLAQMQTLALALLKQPTAPVAALSPLAETERQQQILDWNNTLEDYDPNAHFHCRFVTQAHQRPDAIAVVSDDQSLSYGELDARSNQLSHYLREAGVQPGTLVGIHLERSTNLLVGLLGILKAGGAYVPLDPRFPAERLAMMVEDSAVPVILTQANLADTLDSRNAKRICLDTDWAEIARRPRQPAGIQVHPESLAYTIFTSGSTGRPKGVQIPHRALTSLLLTFERRVGFSADDVMLAVTTLSFDIAGLELYLPLMVGGRVVLASVEDASDGDRLQALLHEQAATVMQATPASWRLLLTTGWKPNPGLRMWCGGEALPVDLAERLIAQGNLLWNVYGPTETTIWSTVQCVASEADARSIGRPIGNTTVYLSDEQFQPTPLGVPGELLIGGVGVGRGYLGQPALTAEKFIPDPYSAKPGAVLYRTGDQARYRDNGQLEFLGRTDTQAKIRGFRIELGEIETVLRQDPDIDAAAVMVREDQPGQQRLVAYLVLKGPQRHPEFIKQIRVMLRERLPDYMIPAVYIDLAALPLTPNGKTHYRALPAPDAAALAVETYLPPRNALEEVLAGLWKDTLGVEQVGVTDNFFTLGGHSLIAAQILAWLRQAFKVNITLRSLFAATTVEELARVLTELEANPERLHKTAEAILKIKAMSPEEKARRLKARQAEGANS